MNHKLTHLNTKKHCPLAHPLDVVHDWLSQSIKWSADISISHVRLRRLWPSERKGITFELLLMLNTKTTKREVTLQGGWLNQPRWTHRRHKAHLLEDTLLGIRLRHESQDLWVCLPDRDKRIRWSSELFDRGELAQLLSTIDHHEGVSDPSDYLPEHLQLSLKAYRVQRRCVAHVTIDSRVSDDGVIVKAFHRLPYDYNLDSLTQLHQQLSQLSQDTIQLPATLAIDQKKRLIVSSCVRSDARPLPYQKEGVTLAAKVLACLHTCDPLTTKTNHAIIDELGTLTRWPNVLTLVCKQLDQHKLSTVIEKLTTHAIHHTFVPPVMIHRDFYRTQLLQHEQTVWLLDLDTLCTGEREVDLATFLAHLILDCTQRNVVRQNVSELAVSFLSSYIKHDGTVNASRLAFYLSCALARLGCIHAVRGETEDTIQNLWTLASTLLDAGVVAVSPMKMLQQVIRKCL